MYPAPRRGSRRAGPGSAPRRAPILLAILGSGCLLSACASLPLPGLLGAAPPPAASADEPAFREAVRVSALALEGRKPEERVQVRGRTFMLDCIGTVSAAYWGAGVDVTVDFPRLEGNGVARLYGSLASRGALEKGREPAVGDAIFWDDTWDRNGDGSFGNDPLTHAGIVVQVDADGTIHYLHENYFSGIVVERMNLRWPDVHKDASGKVLNSPLYMASYPGKKGNPPRFLSGDLFKAFGSGAEIGRSFGAGLVP